MSNFNKKFSSDNGFFQNSSMSNFLGEQTFVMFLIVLVTVWF